MFIYIVEFSLAVPFNITNLLVLEENDIFLETGTFFIIYKIEI